MQFIRCAFALLTGISSLSACGWHAVDTTPHGLASLAVTNLSDLAICEVHLARRDDATWGQDRLEEDDWIAPGETHTFVLTHGRWALRMTDCRGESLHVVRNLRVHGAMRVAFRPVRVQRHPRYGIRRFARQGPRPNL